MIIFSDLHYHEHPEFPTDEIARSVLQQIEDYATKHNEKIIIHAGDLYNSRNRMPIRILKPLIDKFFFWAVRKSWDIYLLKGNPSHDGDSNDFNGNLFPFAKSINSPTQTNYFGDAVGFFLPYGPKESLLRTINYWKKETKVHGMKILFVHYALAGAQAYDYEAPIEDALSKEDVKGFDFVFAGHYHKFQKVFDDNAWHVGSPWRISFSESKDKKGFIHFTENKVKFIELDVPNMIELHYSSKGFQVK